MSSIKITEMRYIKKGTSKDMLHVLHHAFAGNMYWRYMEECYDGDLESTHRRATDAVAQYEIDNPNECINIGRYMYLTYINVRGIQYTSRSGKSIFLVYESGENLCINYPITASNAIDIIEDFPRSPEDMELESIFRELRVLSE